MVQILDHGASRALFNPQENLARIFHNARTCVGCSCGADLLLAARFDGWLLKVVNSTYSFSWDIMMDWGLLERPNEQAPWSRSNWRLR